jgi:prepilin-type N-terminal cleavage/methylation domain-containing protein
MPTTVADPRRIPRRRAFTLVELLVTIGIIALLVGILIPVATRIRRSAQIAETQNMINRLQAAITAYQQAHSAYPGIFHNFEITNTNAGSGWNNSVRATSSENLVLSLVGGLEPIFTGNPPTRTTGVRYTGTATRVTDELNKGPMSLNWRKPQRYRAYLDAQPAELSTSRSDTNLGSVIPEFIDRFPQPNAIIYLRANVGAVGTVGNNDTDYQYNGTHMNPYVGGDYSSLFAAGLDFAKADAYFCQPPANPGGVPTVVKQKDAYMLISAGPDGKYGTKDDITNFGL